MSKSVLKKSQVQCTSYGAVYTKTVKTRSGVKHTTIVQPKRDIKSMEVTLRSTTRQTIGPKHPQEYPESYGDWPV